MALAPVIDTKENQQGGILVVTMPGYGPKTTSARRSFFFDKQVDQGPVLNQFRQWFDLWGIPVERSRGFDTDFERSFYTFEWPKVPIEPHVHGPQLIPKIALHLFELIDVLAIRQPKVIVFLSCYLWKAVNLSADAFLTTLGRPRDQGRRITSRRLSAYIQHWDKTTMLALAMPGKNTTDDYVLSLAQGVREALRSASLVPKDSTDPLLCSAANLLAIDRELSIRLIQTELHVIRDRAEKLFDSLEGQSYEKIRGGKILRAIKKATE